MFLKSIELFGFKSFADKSKIEFGDGISTIVGPNGCGKSNIIDAVRWVLGEQSSKGMRTDKMSSVIFNGTEQRHPLNVAEVSLVFSNEENLLPLDFSEVVIKRRIFRDSNSEYYINGSIVPLKDLREILADTGIGISEYIVMEQGKLDQILEAKPIDRRLILEEAAGIKKFRMRSQEGTRRRERVKENIGQLEQIFSEVEHQHKTLKSQSEKAIKHRELREIQSSCEIILECKKYLSLSKDHELHEKKSQELEHKLTQLQIDKEDLNKENLGFLNEIKVKEEEKIELQKRQSIIQTEQTGISRVVGGTKEHIADIQVELKKYSMYSKELQASKVSGQKKILSLSDDKEIQEKNISILQKKRNMLIKKRELQEQKISQLYEANISLDSSLLELGKKLEEQQSELRKVIDRLAEELDKRLEQSGYSAKEQKSLENLLFKNLTEVQNKLIEFKALFTSKVTNKSSTNLSTSLETLIQMSKDTSKLFKKYNTLIPSFLNDFLKSDGVLARKHIIVKNINEYKGEISKSHNKINNNKSKIKNLESENTILLQEIHDINIEINSLEQSVNALERETLALEQSIRGLDSQLKTHNESIQNYNAALQKWNKELEVNNKKYDELKQEYKKIESQIKDVSKEINVKYSESNVYKTKQNKLVKDITHLQESIYNEKLKINDINTRISLIEEAFREKHGSLIQSYLTQDSYKQKFKEDIDTIKEKLQNTKNQIQALGSLNLLAAEEFVQIDERYKLLSTQLDDLYKSEKHLQEVVAKIENESRKKLEDTFVEVRKHFKNIFTKVMGGGKADIELVDSDDILDAGLEIYAQPPEKKTQYLSQLSGGERTLIALSLLFALHSAKPAPFCLLDELDAPLDDNNIDRFLDLLHSFKEITQFVVISHNKRSIAQSQNIIGVTMEEKGVSKFISVRLEDEKK